MKHNRKSEEVTLLLRLPAQLEEDARAMAGAKDLSVNAWIVQVLEANVKPEEAFTRQHDAARRILPFIFESWKAAQHGARFPTYGEAAEKLGRDPRDNARFMGSVTDLIDAAAYLVGVPSLALWTVRNSSRDVNPKAWTGRPFTKAWMIGQAKQHLFMQADIDAIQRGLDELRNVGNKAAWQYVLTKKGFNIFEELEAKCAAQHKDAA